MRRLMLLAALLLTSAANAGALTIEDDGRYSWQIDSTDGQLITVRIENGILADLHMQNYHCWPKPRQEAVFLGTVSADENFAWFRSFVENPRLDERVREHALYGMVQSDTDAVYAYLDAMLSKTG